MSVFKLLRTIFYTQRCCIAIYLGDISQNTYAMNFIVFTSPLIFFIPINKWSIRSVEKFTIFTLLKLYNRFARLNIWIEVLSSCAREWLISFIATVNGNLSDTVQFYKQRASQYKSPKMFSLRFEYYRCKLLFRGEYLS